MKDDDERETTRPAHLDEQCESMNKYYRMMYRLKAIAITAGLYGLMYLAGLAWQYK